ncbi:hypothetical protein MCUN1_002645 [Malassezia cuniculi]|uniref:Pre-mRNA-splicing factor 18 n=1 Tax=Malassezia cuniculi TaxID=948313 RepID=A0AAF0F040_9BASI|nr:hypothetical protein MCUN1_002645 [Malassezia cuniculi]
MDALKAQIAARKRKAADIRAGRDKYARRGELVDAQEEHEPENDSTALEDTRETPEEENEAAVAETEAPAAPHWSPAEISRRLRSFGEPIRFFDESEHDRADRLRAAELREYHGRQTGRTDYLKALEGTETDLSLSADKAEQIVPKEREGVGMNQVIDLALLRKDPAKLYPMIYYTLKGLMADWEASLAKRPDDVRLSTDGRLHTAAYLQSAENIKPLFKLLRRRALEPDVLVRMSEIVHYMQQREYRQANDSYLQLSIGNAPWPIGVAMIGIHEGPTDFRLYTANKGHALSDEPSA